MTKPQTIFSCSKCGAQSLKWSGRCLECGGWGTLKEEIKDVEGDKRVIVGKLAEVFELSEIKDEKLVRIKTHMDELNRVFGGGIVPGSLVLLSGEPGIGKSTIVAQIAGEVAESGTVIYASGEESAPQVKERLVRINALKKNIKFLSETNVESIVGTAKKIAPRLLIVDSIQTIFTASLDSEPGSVSQIRASAAYLLELAKENNIPIIIIGHITKDGSVAGPKTLEHMVDTVIYLEADDSNDFRILRATKNRFGSTNELGIFTMTGVGFREVANPSAVFVERDEANISGSVISVVMEGTRPFLAEIQALVTKTVFGYPQRKSSGYDLNRLQVLIAVMSKRTKINLSTQDVILNIIGGLKINDYSIDLAVCLAIASSLSNKPIKKNIIAIGEVGLGGEIRKATKLDVRLKEAAKLGFKTAYIPNQPTEGSGIEIVKFKNLGEALERI
jgi:DNA repair protein RadA/Sms